MSVPGSELTIEGRERKFNILIVDDIAENIEVLGSILSQEGYQIGIARQGTEALARAQSGLYDLILLDVIMPGMNGFEVCEHLKKDDRTREIPVIFVSARIEKESIIQGFKAGGQDYVTKPFNALELLARVKTHIEVREKRKILESVNRILEERVNERTAELVRANRKLSHLERAKSDFLALISHEIRTPLNGIVNLIQLLEEFTTSEEQKDFIGDLKVSIDRLARFSETALLVTSFKVNQPGISRSSVPLSTLLSLCISQFLDRVREKGITLTTSIEPAGLTAALDLELMKICLNNVLLNSVKFTEPGGEISIRMFMSGPDVNIVVSDNGPGLGESARAFLFELFSSGDIQHHSEGFGLGLAAARMIMGSHGGTIAMEEGKEGGVTVTLTLPQQVDLAEATARG